MLGRYDGLRELLIEARAMGGLPGLDAPELAAQIDALAGAAP
jgi:hypothetical protein